MYSIAYKNVILEKERLVQFNELIGDLPDDLNLPMWVLTNQTGFERRRTNESKWSISCKF